MPELIRFSRDDIKSWSYFPILLGRIYRFAQATDGETDPLELVDVVKRWFTFGNYTQASAWGMIDDSGKLVAHLFATTEPFGADALKHVLIRQAEVDNNIDIMKECEEVFEQIKAWTCGLGLSKIIMLTHRSETAMARRWGFQTYKSLMRVDLGKPWKGLPKTGS